MYENNASIYCRSRTSPVTCALILLGTAWAEVTCEKPQSDSSCRFTGFMTLLQLRYVD
jgi:hypothetical protein